MGYNWQPLTGLLTSPPHLTKGDIVGMGKSRQGFHIRSPPSTWSQRDPEMVGFRRLHTIQSHRDCRNHPHPDSALSYATAASAAMPGHLPVSCPFVWRKSSPDWRERDFAGMWRKCAWRLFFHRVDKIITHYEPSGASSTSLAAYVVSASERWADKQGELTERQRAQQGLRPTS